MIVAGAICAALCTPLAQQALAPALADLHARAVRAERTARFFEAWDRAPSADRRRVEDALRELPVSGEGLDARPALESLALATRLFDAPSLDAVRDDTLVRFADSIDLRVVPGVVSVRSSDDEAGMALRVDVSRLYATAWKERVELALVWVDPEHDGGGATTARVEPFGASDFARGFSMYVRAPRGSFDALVLAPEVVVDGRTVRGAPVHVLGVSEFGSRFESLATSPAALEAELTRKLLAREPLSRLERMLCVERLGMRFAGLDGPREWAVELDGGATQQAADGARLPGELLRAPREGGALSAGLWVVTTPSGEAPGQLFTGPSGRDWRTVAARLGVDVFALERAEVDGARLARVVAELRDRFDAPRVVLIARGDSVAGVHFASARERVDVDGIVLVSSVAGPGPVLPDVPTLLVGANADAAAPARANVVRARGAATLAFTAERGAAEAIGAWFAAAFASADAASSRD